MPSRLPAATAVLAALLAFVAWHWVRIESPQMHATRAFALCVLGAATPVIAAWTGRRRAWLIGLPVCTLLAAGLVTGLWPGSSGHRRYPGALWSAIDNGARQWFQTHTPFDASRFPTVDGDVQLLLFAAAALLGWLVVCRRSPIPAIVVAFAAVAFPSTVTDIGGTGVRAALFLGIALWTLRVLGRRHGDTGGGSQAFAVGTAVVLAALVVAALPGVAKGAFLNWHSWDPLATDGPQVSVSYVWDQSYQPLVWPKKPTVMFDVWSPHPFYWKVATLESFEGDHWVLSERPELSPDFPGTVASLPGDTLPPDAQHRTAKNTTTITVKVAGLADAHLVGTGQPVTWHPPQNVQATLESDGSMVATADLARNAQYSMLAYTPDVSPSQLDQAGIGFPTVIADGVVVNGQPIPAWPAKPPAQAPVSPWLKIASDQVWRRSGAYLAKNEWDAVADVEHYLRGKPFVYNQRVRYAGQVPVLAQFLLSKHAGYCQMFSGAMALVLRLHGIPSRVAVGFTTGTPPTVQGGPYVVTDRDAHAWVEAYFPGYGWEPFDPTPTRHLPTINSTSNADFALVASKAYSQLKGAARKQELANAKFLGVNKLAFTHGHSTIPPGRSAAGPVRDSSSTTAHRGSGRASFVTAALLLGCLLMVLAALVKLAAVRWRYLRRDPHARAGAVYHELSTFIGDQGVPPVSSRTFEEMADEIQRTYFVDATALATAASRARYGRRRGADRAEREMRRELRVVKRQLRRRLTVRERAVGALRLRAALSQTTPLE